MSDQNFHNVKIISRSTTHFDTVDKSLSSILYTGLTRLCMKLLLLSTPRSDFSTRVRKHTSLLNHQWRRRLSSVPRYTRRTSGSCVRCPNNTNRTNAICRIFIRYAAARFIIHLSWAYIFTHIRIELFDPWVTLYL